MHSTQFPSIATAALLTLAISIGGGGAAFAAGSPERDSGSETADVQPSPVEDASGDNNVSPVEEASTDDNASPAEESAEENTPEPTADCVVVVWQMPSWVSDFEPTWPQSFVSVHEADCASAPIDAEMFPVPETCGTQYQLDLYYVSEKTSALIAGGILMGYGPEEDLVPGTYGTLVKNPDCDLDSLPTFPTTTAAATFDMPDCMNNPGAVQLTNEEGVVWTMNGAMVAGNSSHTVSPGTTVSLLASLEEDFAWNDADQRTEWVQEFAAAENCPELLALTGAGDSLGGLAALAALMTAAGVGFVARRRLLTM